MKTLQLLLVSFALVAFVVTGCKKQGVDTKPIETSFSTADPATKSSADKAVTSIKSGDYGSAMAELQKLGTQAKLTDDQKKAISSTLDQVKEQLKAAADKAAKDVKKGMEDVQKSLGK